MKHNPTREDILDYWNNLNRHAQKDRNALIRDMALEFGISPQIIEREIGEWEAGKGGRKS